jgi:hypothetical protein
MQQAGKGSVEVTKNAVSIKTEQIKVQLSLYAFNKMFG